MLKRNIQDKFIWLHEQAPDKPREGQPCNGCGVCCASEPCPVAIIFLWQRHGRCRALEWDEIAQHYRCGMLRRPEYYVRSLPDFLGNVLRPWIKRQIAADTVCDARDDQSRP
jgi:hypothetical protein